MAGGYNYTSGATLGSPRKSLPWLSPRKDISPQSFTTLAAKTSPGRSRSPDRRRTMAFGVDALNQPSQGPPKLLVPPKLSKKSQSHNRKSLPNFSSSSSLLLDAPSLNSDTDSNILNQKPIESPSNMPPPSQMTLKPPTASLSLPQRKPYTAHPRVSEISTTTGTSSTLSEEQKRSQTPPGLQILNHTVSISGKTGGFACHIHSDNSQVMKSPKNDSDRMSVRSGIDSASLRSSTESVSDKSIVSNATSLSVYSDIADSIIEKYMHMEKQPEESEDPKRLGESEETESHGKTVYPSTLAPTGTHISTSIAQNGKRGLIDPQRPTEQSTDEPGKPQNVKNSTQTAEKLKRTIDVSLTHTMSSLDLSERLKSGSNSPSKNSSYEPPVYSVNRKTDPSRIQHSVNLENSLRSYNRSQESFNSGSSLSPQRMQPYINQINNSEEPLQPYVGLLDQPWIPDDRYFTGRTVRPKGPRPQAARGRTFVNHRQYKSKPKEKPMKSS